jgi:hypothetical protein
MVLFIFASVAEKGNVEIENRPKKSRRQFPAGEGRVKGKNVNTDITINNAEIEFTLLAEDVSNVNDKGDISDGKPLTTSTTCSHLGCIYWKNKI